MTREKPLGSAEAAVLNWLGDHGGKWEEGDGVVWENKFWTIRLLDSLCGKGLVVDAVPGAHYRLTDKGMSLLFGRGFVPPVPVQRSSTYTGGTSARNVAYHRPN